MPISAMQSETITVSAPTRMGATRRQVNCYYQSGNRERSHGVGDTILNPYEGEERYFRVQAHEQTHEAHNIVLKSAEEAGYIKEGAADAVSHGVHEMLALMVDHSTQMYYKQERATKAAEGDKGTFKHHDFKMATVMRAQAPYALSQFWTRTMIHNFIDHGVVLPTEEVVSQIAASVEPRLTEVHRLGVDMIQYRSPLLSNLSELGPYDGANYIVQELQGDKSEEPELSPIRKAFEERFGKDWLWGTQRKDARAILLGLYAETGLRPEGNEEDMEYFAGFVRTADPGHVRQILLDFGLEPEYI